MFNLFRKKPSQVEQAVSLIFSVLNGQISLAPDGIDVREVSEDEWALGYIFGYVDSVLQALQIKDEDVSLVVMTGAHEKLFGSDGARVLRRSFTLQGKREFLDGMMTGGEEAVSFFNTKIPPLGLTTHLRSK